MDSRTAAPSLDPAADREKVVRRARRLRSLSASPNRHEADSASRKLAAYMREHHLAEVDLVEDADQAVFEVALSSPGGGGFEAPWKWWLASFVAELHGCAAVGERDQSRLRVKLVGDRNDAREAELHFCALYKAVRAEGERFLAEVFTRRPDLPYRIVGAWARSFLLGVVEAVSLRLVRYTARPASRGAGRSAPRAGSSAGDARPADPSAGALVRASRRGDDVDEYVSRRYGGREDVVVGWRPGGFDFERDAAYRAGLRRGAVTPLPSRYS